ncbi:MAG: haloacid dehalogenase type II [Actinomycetota bacterium]|nr:haloacid dehalogenase type II [Actinomycetota bacterium]
MPETRALLFDVFGTLVDWRASLVDEASAAGSRAGVGADWTAVVDDWRRAYQPALDRVRAGQEWCDLDVLQRETLAEILDRHGVALPAEEQETLVRGWRRLRPWPDTRGGLERLRARFCTATLSNGHMALLVDLFRFADLRVDAILSAQLADSYKPDPRVYRRGAELLGCEPGQAVMVAAHSADLVAAAHVGLRPAFVRRPDEWGPGRGPGGPGGGEQPPGELANLVVAEDLEQLADLLDC